ncbi:MAG: YabP/YqfC family sporulation protein [Bacilli bacterium]|jgi:sporulation protein YqfC|nr:YabP/YqfC family sporulation protein [Bacilli bacterium]
MNIIEKITNYVYDKELSISLYKNKLNIINYIDIVHFDNNKIKLKHEQGIIIVTGYNLVVTKLLNNELLISGEIKNIELG